MEEKKKIVVYFGKKCDTFDPLKEFGEKKEVWQLFFQRADEFGFQMYLSSGENAYLGNLFFGNVLKYENGKFVESEDVKADAIYDRSSGEFFPTLDIGAKVVNSKDFKDVCWDKSKTHELLGQWMPKSQKVSSQEELHHALAKYASEELIVLKPARDTGGRGIFIDCAEKLKETEITRDYLVQQFVETAEGIEGIARGRHDLRMVIAAGKLVLAHVRTPKDEGYLCNVAQGGNIEEIVITNIPQYILDTVEQIREIIDTTFNHPFYSIDLGIMDNKVYVFEINDTVGFPYPWMKNKNKFIDGLITVLHARANAAY